VTRRVVTRRHGTVLAAPLAKAVALAAAGGILVSRAWPWSLPGAILVAAGAVLALGAVWRWERTRIVVTAERLLVVSGTLARRTTTLPLAGGALQVEQTLLGRLLGYGTVAAGDTVISHVPEPRRLLERAEP
jgi:membrane protein YdbS with pleckstrin-like domain